MMTNTTQENVAILQAAFNAWCAAADLRARRRRNKRFTYGDQWIDSVVNAEGKTVSEWTRYCNDGLGSPITNNVLRQLVKSIVGRFRAEHLRSDAKDADNINVQQLNELDSRLLEEFLISGCCVQRIDKAIAESSVENTPTTVTNVNFNRFFINAIIDPLMRDCEIVGQIHDLSVAELLQRVAGGERRKAAWVRNLYSNGCDERTADFQCAIGADSQAGNTFFQGAGSKCRAIEVWTLESQEVLLCHNQATAEIFTAPVSQERKWKATPNVAVRWSIKTCWRCRWFSPMGDLLTQYDSPYSHGSHPFAVKLYPLTDGEVHSFIEDVIDQQKHVNRMVTLIDQVMASSAKGVLLFPDEALPDGFTWNEVLRIWRSNKGILPYAINRAGVKPEQIAQNNTNIGAYEMINLQLKLLEEISGVSGALQGKAVNTSGSASLYQTQADNANIGLTDIYDTFNHFRAMRNNLLKG